MPAALRLRGGGNRAGGLPLSLDGGGVHLQPETARKVQPEFM